MMQDVVVNGTALMVPDGIEDADSPVTDCSGAQSDRFAGEFACVQVRADVPTGLCYPKSSFAPCERPQDCVAGESCGFLLVLGSVETRCVVQPAGAIGLGGDCSYEAGATAIACSAWACGSNGCTRRPARVATPAAVSVARPADDARRMGIAAPGSAGPTCRSRNSGRSLARARRGSARAMRTARTPDTTAAIG